MLTTEERQEIAANTAFFLGGTGRLQAMVNAKYFSCDDTGALSFRFSSCRKANHVKFELTSLDLYKITFYKVGKFDSKVVHEIDGLYNDQIKKAFENYTGLYLSL